MDEEISVICLDQGESRPEGDQGYPMWTRPQHHPYPVIEALGTRYATDEHRPAEDQSAAEGQICLSLAKDVAHPEDEVGMPRRSRIGDGTFSESTRFRNHCRIL